MSSFVHLSKKKTKSFSHIIMFWTGVCLQCLHPSLLWSNSSHTARGGEYISYDSACVLCHSVSLYIWCTESEFSLLVSVGDLCWPTCHVHAPVFLSLYFVVVTFGTFSLPSWRMCSFWMAPVETIIIKFLWSWCLSHNLSFFFLGTLLVQRFSMKPLLCNTGAPTLPVWLLWWAVRVDMYLCVCRACDQTKSDRAWCVHVGRGLKVVLSSPILSTSNSWKLMSLHLICWHTAGLKAHWLC